MQAPLIVAPVQDQTEQWGDTRADIEQVDSAILTLMAGIFGYAAKPIGNKLVRKGGELATAPEGFAVEGTEGPLRDGELERAAEWAKQVLA